jgi:hypothetical protein
MTDISATAPSVLRRLPGRPPGTTYDWVDTPRYDEMEALLKRHEVTSLWAAAGSVMHQAYGYGYVDDDWLKRRLVTGFRRNRST